MCVCVCVCACVQMYVCVCLIHVYGIQVKTSRQRKLIEALTLPAGKVCSPWRIPPFFLCLLVLYPLLQNTITNSPNIVNIKFVVATFASLHSSNRAYNCSVGEVSLTNIESWR